MPADFLLFVIIGFAAQLIDGAIGMAYGLASTTILLSMGVAPATASASVHTAEVFTTAASSLSHWRCRARPSGRSSGSISQSWVP